MPALQTRYEVIVIQSISRLTAIVMMLPNHSHLCFSCGRYFCACSPDRGTCRIAGCFYTLHQVSRNAICTEIQHQFCRSRELCLLSNEKPPTSHHNHRSAARSARQKQREKRRSKKSKTIQKRRQTRGSPMQRGTLRRQFPCGMPQLQTVKNRKKRSLPRDSQRYLPLQLSSSTGKQCRVKAKGA